MSSQEEIVLQRLKENGEDVYINLTLKIVYYHLAHRILYALFKDIENSEGRIKWGILVHTEFFPDYRTKYLTDCISIKEFAQKVENAKD